MINTISRLLLIENFIIEMTTTLIRNWFDRKVAYTETFDKKICSEIFKKKYAPEFFRKTRSEILRKKHAPTFWRKDTLKNLKKYTYGNFCNFDSTSLGIWLELRPYRSDRSGIHAYSRDSLTKIFNPFYRNFTAHN